ncbi:hypothetical protein V5T82_04155 [Magnetovibrio sp. PR-2]|uniref:hypothetical protein n=1 Tax=Magnetovibrio sp. PR-2 TaxID=3120356 RepID=UPI002FCDEC14
MARHWLSFSLGVTLTLSAIAPNAVKACGWWGDGDVGRELSLPPEIDLSGKSLEQNPSLQSAKLPGEMGYGIALPNPGRALPYLLTTNGRPVNKIGELKAYGYKAVIDLGTAPKSAKLHRAETEAVGMTYYSLPLEGNMPSQDEVMLFRELVLASSDAPLLVYAPKASLLGVMWAGYRLSFKTPLSYALTEGRDLGLTDAQAETLSQWDW